MPLVAAESGDLQLLALHQWAAVRTPVAVQLCLKWEDMVINGQVVFESFV